MSTIATRALFALLFAVSAFGCAAETTDTDATETEDELRAKDAASLTTSDVSVLFPAPTGSSAGYLTASTVGRGGAFLPESVVDALPSRLDFSTAGLTSGRLYYAGANLVGLRLDPCSGRLGTDVVPACLAEVRLVFQPSGTGGMDDGAVHAFYRLTRTEVLSLLDTIVRARKASGGPAPSSLGVHPVAAREGMQGAFARVVTAKVKELAGAQNLVKVTFFGRGAGRPKKWTFGQFDIDRGIPTAATITTVGSTTQLLDGSTVTPASSHADNFMKLPAFDDSRRDAALRVENPRFHTPNTMGCVECHETPSELVLLSPGNRFQFTSPVSTAVVGTGGDAENLHFFSYMGRTASVSQRTGNESAQVVERFRTILRGR
ncbi:MAG: hypothetical protein JNM74_04885 [Myxococcales bacterium]|nr:hypothetical protein [Myxococcales bacterium]